MKFDALRIAVIMSIMSWISVSITAHQPLSGPHGTSFYCATTVGETYEVEADEVAYTQGTQMITATGNVKVSKVLIEASQGHEAILEHELECDHISYSLKTKQINATGQVRLKEPDGTVLHAKSVELSGDLKTGIVRSLIIVTQDRTRLWAGAAKRHDSNTTNFIDAGFTPCLLYEKGKQTWQLEADRVSHLEKEKVLKFYRVKLKVGGIPVLYLPYLSIPDPSVKRRSGLLLPIFGRSNDLGLYYSQPYFFATKDFEDFTVTPLFMSRQNPAIFGEYRRQFVRGKLFIDASGTIVGRHGKIPTNPTRPTRWHITTHGNTDLNRNSRIVWDITRASDIDYLNRYRLNLQRYTFTRQKTLDSSIAVEHYLPRGIAVAKIYSFQTAQPNYTPLVIPKLFFQNFCPTSDGGTVNIEGDLLALYRRDPTMSPNGLRARAYTRLALQAIYTKPYIDAYGSWWEMILGLRGDGVVARQYRKCDLMRYSQQTIPIKNRSYINTMPIGKVQWRLPMQRFVNQGRWIIEPTMAMVSQPFIGKKNEINEDCQIMALDETNLFSINRLGGWDQYDNGSRFIAGIQQWLYQPDGKRFGLFLGQSYRLDHKQILPYGENKKRSDYLVRALAQTNEMVKIHWRTAIDGHSHKIRISEIGTSIGTTRVIDISHIYTPVMFENSNKPVSQLQFSLKLPFTNQWSTYFAQVYNLSHRQKQSTLATFCGVRYKDEDGCFQVRLGFYRNAYRDADMRPDTGIRLDFILKHLGSIAPLSAPEYPMSPLVQFNR